MANEDKLEDKFPDIEAVDRFLSRSRLHLMDVNHNLQKSALRRVEALEDYQANMNQIIEEMKQAEAVGAMLIARMSAERIQTDFDLVPIEIEIEEEYEEEGEEDE